jgi:GNAT superfamily N-acetyltransferase
MIIEEIDFLTIENIWRNKLWPGRISAIEPYSTMMFMHDRYDAEFANRPRIFLGGFINSLLVAVTSLHLAEARMARHRGLWVDPEFRKQGNGTKIITAASAHAGLLGADAIWSFPRKSSMSAYCASGYIQSSPWVNHGEFGPNCYAICFLEKYNQ